MQGKLDIAVAGAGPGGLAAALYLHRAGHRVTVFERFDKPRPIGSGLMIQPTGQAVLKDLGLFDEIFVLGAPIDGLLGHDAKSGRIVLDVRYRALRGVGRGLGVHRAALFGVLHRAVLAEAIPVVTRFGVTGRDGRYLCSGAQREGPFDLLVDTLGASSPLKGEAKYPGTAEGLAFGAIWGTTPWVEAGFSRYALMQRYRHAKVMLGVLPIGRKRPRGPELAAFFWSLKTAEYGALVERGLEAWKDEVRGYWPETEPHLAAIKDFSDMSLARYQHGTLRVPAGDGIVFVGDSAHSTSPQLGQGANMALLDAKALAVALESASDVPEALAAYAAMRRWHVRLYQFLSYALTPFYQSDSVALPAVRDVLVSVVAKMPPMPQLLAAMVAGQLLSPLNPLGLETPLDLEGRP